MVTTVFSRPWLTVFRDAKCEGDQPRRDEWKQNAELLEALHEQLSHRAGRREFSDRCSGLWAARLDPANDVALYGADSFHRLVTLSWEWSMLRLAAGSSLWALAFQ